MDLTVAVDSTAGAVLKDNPVAAVVELAVLVPTMTGRDMHGRQQKSPPRIRAAKDDAASPGKGHDAV